MDATWDRVTGGNVLHGGVPHLVAAMYALNGWFMVLAGSGLIRVSLRTATEGSFAALLPLPFVVVAFGLAVYTIRLSAEIIRSAMR